MKDFAHDDVGDCFSCDVGKFSNDNNGATSCQSCIEGLISGSGASSCSTCPVGYQCIEGVVSSTCPSGKYSNGETDGCVDCDSRYKCPGGTDRIPCPPGSYSDSASQTLCTNCEAGKFQSDEAQEKCDDCQPGNFCPASSIAEIACQPGLTFQPNSSSTSCQTCSNCPLGQVISAECTVTTDRQCSPCTPPTFSDDGLTCKQCNGKGQYNDEHGAYACKTAKAGHKPTSDRKGEEQCQAGRFSTGGAEQCTECDEGQSSAKGAVGCSTCATCTAGRYLISICSPTSETECGDCLAGKVSMGGNALECTSCTDDGQYSDTNLASACKTAPAGTIPTATRNNVEICPKNTFSIGANNTCTPCADGGHSLPGSSSCKKCSTGKYYNGEANMCEGCPLGKFTATGESAIDNCKVCKDGFVSNDVEGAGFCSPCEAGFYTNIAKTKCLPCPAGSISGIAATTCDLCEIGKFASGTNNTGCLFCDDKNVLKGSTTSSSGSNSTTDCQCEAGEYKNEKINTCEPVFEGVSTSVPGQTVPTMMLEEGYWRTSQYSIEILSCLNPLHCVGGSNPSAYCADGYTGARCAVCKKGFAAIGNGDSLSCNKCNGSATTTIIAFASCIGFLLIAAAIFVVRKGKAHTQRLARSATAFEEAAATKLEKLNKVMPILKIIFAYFQVRLSQK